MRALTAVAAILGLAPALAGQVRYVNAGAASDGSGASWSFPFRSLADALTFPGTFTEVWIAAGTYAPAAPGGARTHTFALPPAVTLRGGFAGSEVGLLDRDPDVSLNRTVLTGDLNGDDAPGFVNTGENALHVVSVIGAGSVTLDRLTITAGSANAVPNMPNPNNGGGVLARGSVLTLVDCSITANQAGNATWNGVGGGIFCGDGSLVLTRTRVSANAAYPQTPFNGGPSGGGGICLDNSTGLLAASSVSSNSTVSGQRGCEGGTGVGGHGADGAGLLLIRGSRLDASDTRISANTTGHGGRGGTCAFSNAGADGGSGGGVWCDSTSSLRLERCVLADNRTGDGGAGGRAGLATGSPPGGRGGQGAGIFLSPATRPGPALVMVNCLLVGNRAGQGGTGGNGEPLTNPPFMSCRGRGGDGGNGGAIYSRQAVADILNCTLTGNIAGAGGPAGMGHPVPPCGADGIDGQGGAVFASGGTLTLSNSIVWENELVSDNSAPASVLIVYSNVPSGSPGIAGGTISADPRFRHAAAGDYRLRSFSPCIDAGDTGAVPAGVTLDADGRARLFDDPAVANTGLGMPPVDIGTYERQSRSCEADFNESGAVTVQDIFDFLGVWFALDPRADVNGVGGVTVQDLFDFLGAYFAGCS